MCATVLFVDAWVQESRAKRNPPPRRGLGLTPTGVLYSDDLTLLCEATWDQVFGVALVPAAAPTRAFILVPRKPPQPPWFEVRVRDIPPEVNDLGALATLVRGRIVQRGYRDVGPRRPLLEADVLMQRVLERADLPGALEVPVGAGPGGWWRRSLDLFAAGSAGGLAGLYAGALTGNPALAVGAAVAGVVVGAGVPVALASNWRSVRLRARKPRVLVLAPDGCVVGLPQGPRAFSWPSIATFRESTHQPPGRENATARRCLELVLADGNIAGRIDAAWFAEPLELIVAVAEAYRQRQTASRSVAER